MRKQIWFACLVCGGAVVPGFLIGGLAVILYKLMTIAALGSDPDFHLLRMLFGIETPGKILGWVVYSAFPAFIRGWVAGSIAALLTHYTYKGPRLDLAAFVTGGVFTGIAAMSELLSYVMYGPDLKMVLIVIEAVGLWVGFLSVIVNFSTPGSSSAI